MRLGIFGTGYVGLVSAVCFADLGHNVIAVEKDTNVVARLRGGRPTIYEPGLEERLAAGLAAGHLEFTTRPEDAIAHAEIVFLCVGTPAQPDGSTDLTQIEEVARSIAPLLNGYTLIVEKSTVPVNTAYWIDQTVRRFAGRAPEFDVASNPEFLREGSAIRDFLRPHRIVIGADTNRARALLTELYSTGFDCPVLVADVKTAELIKHSANAFLATKISFINMIADLCESVGVDVTTVAKGIGLDPRIGGQFLQAGLGYGGSCFPKDLKSFIKIADELGANFDLLREVQRINEDRVARLLKRVDRALGVVRGRVIGILGVAFKPDTDDIREAPSLKVVPALLEAGALLRIYDPRAAHNFKSLHPPLERLAYTDSAYDAAREADALVVLTDWEEFRSLDFERLRRLMRTPIVIDGRNFLTPAEMQAHGFEYYGLGRGDAMAFLTSASHGLDRHPPAAQVMGEVHESY
jgi:UDPglucose 6-dehydrogenase